MDKYIISYQGRNVSKIDADSLELSPDGQSVLSLEGRILAIVPADHLVINITKTE